ncbi:MAG TPA: DUF1800 domain-containing protein [Chthoniobacterales bacterium]
MLTPLPASAWNRSAAAHLALRAGFGANPDEVDRLAGAGLEKAVEQFLSSVPEETLAPVWTDPRSFLAWREKIRLAQDPVVKRELERQNRQEGAAQMRELTLWWLERMAVSRAPLAEKAALFWHGHFATSNDKVHSPYKMYLQNEAFRRGGLGDARELTKAVSRDPAMLVWLDLNGSRKEYPNENFARELLELFTLGEGHYTEQDVKEAARAFTGYRVEPSTQTFRCALVQQDAGLKTFLGQTGAWDGDQVIDIIFDQPRCAQFLGVKLWRFFVLDDEPSPALAAALGHELGRHGCQLRPFLRTVFSSATFYSPTVRSRQIKSPVQWLVQTCRTLGAEVPPASVLENAFRRLGQTPFYPPNVKGWDGGKAWINTATLSFRYAFGRQLVMGRTPPQAHPAVPAPDAAMAGGSQGPVMAGPDIPAAARAAVPPEQKAISPLPLQNLIDESDRRSPRQLIARLCDLIYAGNPPTGLPEQFLPLISSKPLPLNDQAVRELVALMLETPYYQLC